MTTSVFDHVLILTGPTGSGKSSLSLELAPQLNAEIVSMDSMALYRGMDILSAKPDEKAQAQVPHHLIDILNPWESASVAWWLEQAERVCQDIIQRAKQPLIVGGTPLYLKALLYGLFEGPPADEALREQLTQRATQEGGESLHAELAKVDSISANRLHPNDIRRIVRALEVYHLTGKPISEWQQQWSEPPTTDTFDRPRCLCLDWDRAELYERINVRVLQMIEEGLIQEVEALRNLSQAISREASQAVGYQDCCDYLDGQISKAEMISKIQQRSRRYAKRQLTWFRHTSECQFVSRELTFTLWKR